MSESSSSADGSSVSISIRFKSDSYDAFVARYGGDVSPGGIFIRSAKPLAVGTKLTFQFSLLNGNPILDGSGTVVWVRQSDPQRSAGTVPGMGIRFDQLSEEGRVRLNRILAEKAKLEREGKPVGRGPTPIPDRPFGEAMPRGMPDVTAKVQLSESGQIVANGAARVPPAPRGNFGVPTVAGRPSQASLDENARARGADPDRAFTETTRQARPGGRHINEPFPTAQGRTPPPVAGGGMASRAAFSEPTRAVPAARAGGAISADMGQPGLRIGGAAAVLGRMPGAGGGDARGSVGSQSTDRATGTLGKRGSGASDWDGAEKTELNTELPAFGFMDAEDDMEEKTTNVRGQSLPLQGVPAVAAPAANSALEALRHLTPRPPKSSPAPEFEGAPTTASRARLMTPELDNLFEGEELPVAPASESLVGGVPLLDQSTARLSPIGSSGGGASNNPSSSSTSGTSMLAAKRGRARQAARGALWVMLGAAIVGVGVFLLVQFLGDGVTTSLNPSLPVPYATPVGAAKPPVEATPTGGPEGAAATPTPSETPEPDPAAAAEPVADPTAKPAAEPVAEPAAGTQVAPAGTESAPEPDPGAAAAAAATAQEPKEAQPAGRKVKGKQPRAPGTRPPAGAAAATSPADQQPHWLRVRSVPGGADVFIDGVKEGQTPFERRMFDVKRPYAVSVRKAGHESHERMLSASDPWLKTGGGYQLTIVVKLRADQSAPAGDKGGGGGAATPGPAPSPR